MKFCSRKQQAHSTISNLPFPSFVLFFSLSFSSLLYPVSSSLFPSSFVLHMNSYSRKPQAQSTLSNPSPFLCLPFLLVLFFLLDHISRPLFLHSFTPSHEFLLAEVTNKVYHKQSLFLPSSLSSIFLSFIVFPG